MSKSNDNSIDVELQENIVLDEKYQTEVEGNCIGCGGRATRTNNTLCQKCWEDAEGFEE